MSDAAPLKSCQSRGGDQSVARRALRPLASAAERLGAASAMGQGGNIAASLPRSLGLGIVVLYFSLLSSPLITHSSPRHEA